MFSLYYITYGNIVHFYGNRNDILATVSGPLLFFLIIMPILKHKFPEVKYFLKAIHTVKKQKLKLICLVQNSHAID
jgi:hypothetical protein